MHAEGARHNASQRFVTSPSGVDETGDGNHAAARSAAVNSQSYFAATVTVAIRLISCFAIAEGSGA